jgi:hypothetical protein
LSGLKVVQLPATSTFETTCKRKIVGTIRGATCYSCNRSKAKASLPSEALVISRGVRP